MKSSCNNVPNPLFINHNCQDWSRAVAKKKNCQAFVLLHIWNPNKMYHLFIKNNAEHEAVGTDTHNKHMPDSIKQQLIIRRFPIKFHKYWVLKHKLMSRTTRYDIISRVTWMLFTWKRLKKKNCDLFSFVQLHTQKAWSSVTFNCTKMRRQRFMSNTDQK